MGGGGFLGPILEIAAAVALPGIGAAIAPALEGGLVGLDAADALIAGDALAGAGLGAATSAATSGNVLEGAALGGVGGAVQGSGILKEATDAVGNAFSDVGSAIGDSLGLTGDASATVTPVTDATTDSLGGIPSTPTSTVGSTGTPQPSSGIDNLSDTNIDQALNNSPSAGGTAATALNSSTGSSPFQDISGSQIGGFQNAPDVAASAPTAAGTTGLSTDGVFETGGGASYDSALNSSIPSSNAASGSTFSSASTLKAGGGLTASTGVAPVASNNFFSDLTSGNLAAAGGDALNAISNIPVKSLGGIAGTAYQALAGQPQLPKAERQLQESLANEQQQSINQYNAGQVTPTQQADLDKQLRDANNLTYQQFASMGISNPQQDSRFAAALQNNAATIEQQKNAMLQQTFTSSSTAATGLQEIGKDQVALDNQYSTEIDSVSKALFELLGS